MIERFSTSRMFTLLFFVFLFYSSPLYLWPALAVIALAVLTKKVVYALGCGVLVAAVIIAQGNIADALSLMVNRYVYEITSKDHVYIFGFLLLLGFLIELMTHAGAMRAYTKTISTYLQSRRSVEVTSLLLSSIFFYR